MIRRQLQSLINHIFLAVFWADPAFYVWSKELAILAAGDFSKNTPVKLKSASLRGLLLQCDPLYFY